VGAYIASATCIRMLVGKALSSILTLDSATESGSTSAADGCEVVADMMARSAGAQSESAMKKKTLESRMKRNYCKK
jgi:hypothetical protein